jgi:hypothetical protein
MTTDGAWVSCTVVEANQSWLAVTWLAAPTGRAPTRARSATKGVRSTSPGYTNGPRMMLEFLRPATLATRSEAPSPGCPVPKAPGVYGWWFRRLPTALDISRCAIWRGLRLLYTGISPTRPPANGRPASSQHLRSRITTTTRATPRARRCARRLGA